MKPIGKYGDRMVSELDIFFCDICSQKLILIKDETLFRLRKITLFCGKCQQLYLMEIRKA